MKNKKLIIITVVLALILSIALVGCKVKMTTGDIYSLASYDMNSGETGREITIQVKMGDTTVYSYINGVQTSVQGVDFETASFGTAGDSLQFKSQYFSQEELIIDEEFVANYSADIINAKDFLNVSNAQNAKVGVKVQAKQKKLQEILISYDVANNGYEFTVMIKVEMTY